MLRVGYHSCEEAGAGRWGREDKGTGALSVTWNQTPSSRGPTAGQEKQHNGLETRVELKQTLHPSFPLLYSSGIFCSSSSHCTPRELLSLAPWELHKLPLQKLPIQRIFSVERLPVLWTSPTLSSDRGRNRSKERVEGTYSRPRPPSKLVTELDLELWGA